MALTGGAWIILGCYLYVTKWDEEFEAANHQICTMVTWVRLQGLPIYMFDRKLIRELLKTSGKILKADVTTADAARGRFARIAMEIDLSKPLRKSVIVDQKKIRLEYENVHEFCYRRGRVGHNQDSCAEPGLEAGKDDQHMTEAEGETNNAQHKDSYGPWMKVQARKRRPTTNTKATAGTQHRNANRYQGLETEDASTTTTTQEVTSMAKQADVTRTRHRASEASQRPIQGTTAGGEGGIMQKEATGRTDEYDSMEEMAREGATSRRNPEGVWIKQPASTTTFRQQSSLLNDKHTTVVVEDDSTRIQKRARAPVTHSPGRPPDSFRDHGGTSDERMDITDEHATGLASSEAAMNQ